MLPESGLWNTPYRVHVWKNMWVVTGRCAKAVTESENECGWKWGKGFVLVEKTDGKVKKQLCLEKPECAMNGLEKVFKRNDLGGS